ncbi:hypothetical protein FHX49_002007 [Microbacterium endophyticum]|uniref:Uncharacterized protein n=1 Tax=Microbacterium endophyticum TaxID=1526412 RepID=A0A7W4YNQ9_9MICO|nr:hypothetical protein [Microbacterium endophyticum]MBB2976432.1 hypothetical protein [Microbacterium endophyticum]NIK35878.1 hypothetical protein [Microbacterium endophyticum]
MDTTETVAAPAEQSTKRRRTRTAIIGGIGAVALAAGAVGVGLVGSGAWFSSSKDLAGNTITAGSLVIGDFGPGGGGTVQATAVQPMTATQAVDADNLYEASVVDIDITNDGDIAFDWETTLANATIEASDGVTVLDLANVSVAWDTDGAGNWTTSSLSDFITNESFSGTDVAPGETQPASFRVYFDSAAGNDYQGAIVTFDVNATATQTIEVP